MAPELAIVVLAWNQRELTLECLASLAALDHPAGRLEIVVVDNGSTDDTARAVREAYPAVTVLETGENLGYAGGNNAGIRHALAQGAEYVCILNNDVTVASAFFAPLLAVLRGGGGVGVVTPLIVDLAQPERVWALGSMVDQRRGLVQRLHVAEPASTLRTAEPFDVDVASGAAMLVRREVFERVGLLDEAFYLYFEETDWCLRVRSSGYRILAVPSSVAWHKVSATLGQTSPVIDYYMLRNHLRFIARHWSGIARLQLLGRTIGRNLLTIAAYTVKPQNGQRLPHRNARLLALRDAALGRWGRMGPDVAAVCQSASP
jgi:GT2 family glycosyltransferase